MQTVLAIVVGCFYADATQLSFAVPLASGSAKVLPPGAEGGVPLPPPGAAFPGNGLQQPQMMQESLKLRGASFLEASVANSSMNMSGFGVGGIRSGTTNETLRGGPETVLPGSFGPHGDRLDGGLGGAGVPADTAHLHTAEVANETMCRAAMKASHFRRLRQELRAQRVRKEGLKQKLDRLKELERQHLVTKARITYHQPKVALRNAKTYLDAALEKLARDMANSRKELRMADRTIQNLRVEHAGIVAKQHQIERSDAAMVINIKVDKDEEANLAGLIKMESELKGSIDAHRMVHVGELRAKVANGRMLQGDLQAQLENTKANATHLADKLAKENAKEQYFEDDKMALEKQVADCQLRVQTLESDLAIRNKEMGNKSEAYDQLQKDNKTAWEDLAAAREALRIARTTVAPVTATVAPTVTTTTTVTVQFLEISHAGTDAQKASDAEREELEEAEMEHANIEQYEEQATQELQPAAAFLEKSSKPVLFKLDAKFANTPAFITMREKVSKAVMMIMS